MPSFFYCSEVNPSDPITPSSSPSEASFPQLEFDVPTACSLDQVFQLKIECVTLRSENYPDSTFEVVDKSHWNEDMTEFILSYEVIRRRAPPLLEGPVTSKISLLAKRKLRVSVLSATEETFHRIGKLVREWQSLCFEKQYKYHEAVDDLFDNLKTECKLIAQCMEDPDRTTHIWNMIVVCEDEALSEIQAVALTNCHSMRMDVSHLATHPRNIRSQVNKNETTRAEGAGTALMNYIIEVSKEQKLRLVSLESVESAVPFYQKFGFKKLNHEPVEWGTIPMSIRL